ncbi:identical protein binding, partial [Homalodisca vitripennis]
MKNNNEMGSKCTLMRALVTTEEAVIHTTGMFGYESVGDAELTSGQSELDKGGSRPPDTVLPEYQAQLAQQARVAEARDTMSDIFARYDFIETSYHFFCQKIDLHLSDDPGPGRSCHPDLKVGGAFQINLHCFQVDYYPYHLASGDRHHWAKYKEGSSPHTQWLTQAHAVFRNTLLQLIESHSTHSPLSRDSQ